MLVYKFRPVYVVRRHLRPALQALQSPDLQHHSSTMGYLHIFWNSLFDLNGFVNNFLSGSIKSIMICVDQLLQPEAYTWQSHLLSFASSLWILCWCWAECVWWCTGSLGHVFIHLSDGVEDQYKTQYWRWTTIEILTLFSANDAEDQKKLQKYLWNLSKSASNPSEIWGNDFVRDNYISQAQRLLLTGESVTEVTSTGAPACSDSCFQNR